MASTSTFQLPYPIATDPADVPKDVKALADQLELVLGQLQAATPALPFPGDLKWVGYPVAAGQENAQCPGWLLCDGREVSRSGVTAALFAKLGTAHGSGDGSGTFNLPDARGRGMIGAGQGPGLTNRQLGARVGEESHVISVGEMPMHTHTGKTTAGKTAAGLTAPGTIPAHSTSAGLTGGGTTGGGTTGGGTTGGGSTGGRSAAHTHGMSANVVASRQGTATGNVVTAVGAAGVYNTGVTMNTESSDHTHGCSGQSIPGLSVPGLAVPALSIPALGINPQPIPQLAVPQLDVPQLDLTADPVGGGAPANNMGPSFVANCLIKT